MPRPRLLPILLALLMTAGARSSVAQAPPAMVRTATVAAEDLAPRRSVTAELRAPRTSTVAGIEAGIVEEVLVVEGDAVAAGDLLVRLDPVRVRLDLEVARAQASASEADLREREAEERQAIRDLELVERSRASGAVSEREILNSTSARDIAAARVDRARKDLAVARARIDLLAQRLEDLAIRAPFDGVVTARLVEVGQWLAPGGGVATLVELDRLEAWLAVPQTVVDAAAADVAGGRPLDLKGVFLRIDATGEVMRLGELRIVPEVARSGRSFTAIGAIANPGRRLLPGMSATAFVPLGEPRAWITLPKDAVLFRETGPIAWVLRGAPDGPRMAMPLPVDLAFPLGDRWAIHAGGLAAGDEVVVEGNERLMPMSPVMPLPAAGAAAAGG